MRNTLKDFRPRKKRDWVDIAWLTVAACFITGLIALAIN
jgi:hypothetical protein